MSHNCLIAVESIDSLDLLLESRQPDRVCNSSNAIIENASGDSWGNFSVKIWSNISRPNPCCSLDRTWPVILNKILETRTFMSVIEVKFERMYFKTNLKANWKVRRLSRDQWPELTKGYRAVPDWAESCRESRRMRRQSWENWVAFGSLPYENTYHYYY